jgi:hypothetical protein
MLALALTALSIIVLYHIYLPAYTFHSTTFVDTEIYTLEFRLKIPHRRDQRREAVDPPVF